MASSCYLRLDSGVVLGTNKFLQFKLGAAHVRVQLQTHSLSCKFTKSGGLHYSIKTSYSLSQSQRHRQFLRTTDEKTDPSPNIALRLSSSFDRVRLAHEFDPSISIEDAVTPPSSWYTDSSFYSFELDRIFYKGWQAVGYTSQIRNPHDYFTGRLGNVEYVVCRDGHGKVHAFHNVCSHHASLLACGSGQKTCFVCPYHGWTYGLDGSLLKATRILKTQKLDAQALGLVPINVAIWGPFIVINLDKEHSSQLDVSADEVGSYWLGSCSEVLALGGVDSSLVHVCRREYIIDCNWKVFCDNYLDGGYHVPYAHKELASGLKLDTYSTEMFERVSIQSCESKSDAEGDLDRLGSKALYAFVFPNFMINRYGPWMDTNLVLPLGPRRCKVVFDYFLEPSLKDDKSFIRESLEDSEHVQMEDIMLCEGVQRGLESPAYCTGRYVADIENAMHHFHCLLSNCLIGEADSLGSVRPGIS